jgi:hypothetical protein
LKLPVAPNNGDRHFSKLFNVEVTKGIIHFRIYPARVVVQMVWYNISDAILPLKIINYVNRKITSYIYLVVFTILLWIHVKHFIALTKNESVRRILFLQLPVRTILVNTSTSDHEKKRESTIALATKEKSMCTHKIS